MNDKKNIIAKFILSCGNFGIQDEKEPDIYAAFWGISIELNLGYIKNNVIYSNNLSKEDILNKFENHLREKCYFSTPLIETIPKLMKKLHVHVDISEELIASIAIDNFEGKIPDFYICDHCHEC